MCECYPSNTDKPYFRLYALLIFLIVIQLKGPYLQAQTCPATATTTISSYPNTYYPGIIATLSTGSTSIDLGAVTYGITPISSGDLLLLIQMQGAQIASTNDSAYGKGVISGGHVNGYLNNAQLLAGNMEYVVATNAVAVTGGTVNLLSPTVNSYKKAGFGAYGQYRYQVIRVATYYNLTIGGTVTAPLWNGVTGGVIVLSVTSILNMNGNTISAAGAGFRGGGGIKYPGGTGLSTDFITLASNAANGSKGEGIAGMPRFINNNNVLLDNGAAVEGYPNGSFGMGAPGNAGGGGTDGNPSSNNQNSGGGGGSNGNIGGKGGNSWSSNLTRGGEPGAAFAQAGASRLVMGGGGGAGTDNDGTGTPGAGFSSSGAAGGGIVIIYANTIINTGTIDISGANGNITTTKDGSGGGGAGGSILISSGSGLPGITANANGGAGGINTGTGTPHGPGGGGGGGVVYASGTLNAASSAAGGANGTTAGGIAYNATSGSPGILAQNHVITQPMSCAVLPVSFLLVSATGNIDKVSIAWKVADEKDVLEYAIERSGDGIYFIPVGTLLYRSSGGLINDYHFTDLVPVTNATSYYRIRSIDNAGRSSYSQVMAVKLPASTGELYISPNPAGESATLSFVSATNGTAEIRLLDITAHTCWQQHYLISTGANVLPLEGLQTLRSGMYLLQYNNGSGIKSAKLLIRH